MKKEYDIEEANIHIDGDLGCGWSEDRRFILFTSEAFDRFILTQIILGGIVLSIGLLIGWRFF